MLKVSHDPETCSSKGWWFQWCVVNQTLNDSRLRLGALTWLLLWAVLFGVLGGAIGMNIRFQCVPPQQVTNDG